LDNAVEAIVEDTLMVIGFIASIPEVSGAAVEVLQGAMRTLLLIRDVCEDERIQLVPMSIVRNGDDVLALEALRRVVCMVPRTL
jgi:hypothetical protein